jgi:hypothetical protein
MLRNLLELRRREHVARHAEKILLAKTRMDW